jgi:hypothetical protein
LQGQGNAVQTQQRLQGQSYRLQRLPAQNDVPQGWQGQSNQLQGQNKVAAGLDSSSSQQIQQGQGQSRMQMPAGQGSIQFGQGQQQKPPGWGSNQENWGFAGIPPGSTVIDVTEVPPVDWTSTNTVPVNGVPGMAATGSAVGSGSSSSSSSTGVSSSNGIVQGPAANSDGVVMPVGTGGSGSSSSSGGSIVGGNNGMMAPSTTAGDTGLPVSSGGSSSGSSGSNAGSSGSTGVNGLPANGVIAQAPGTTVQVLAGRPGSVNTITSGQGQAVTIISIMPAGSSISNGDGVDLSAGGSGGGPVTIWSSNGNQQQLQQMLSNQAAAGAVASRQPAAARSKGQQQQQQQILPALPTEGLEDDGLGADAGGSSLGQGGSTDGATPDFMLGTEPTEAPVPDIKQGGLKPSFGGACWGSVSWHVLLTKQAMLWGVGSRGRWCRSWVLCWVE